MTVVGKWRAKRSRSEDRLGSSTRLLYERKQRKVDEPVSRVCVKIHNASDRNSYHGIVVEYTIFQSCWSHDPIRVFLKPM